MRLIIEAVKNIVWGMPTIGLILSVGVYFTVKSGWFPIRGVREIMRGTVGSLGSAGKNTGVSPFMAVATAIGGTVGVGSIIGVSYAIAAGGAGSLFWMWLSGFFGMMIKYAEVYITLNHRVKTKNGYAGGAMYCLKELGHKRLAVLFCIFCLGASVGAGNLAQTNSVAVIMSGIGFPPIATAALLAFFFAVIIFGGQKKIAGASAVIVPLVSLIYLFSAMYIILLHRNGLPQAFERIFKEAFGIKAAAGGISGAMISQAVKVGFARGVFSNEAGMGSSPIAHTAAEDATPHTQGMWGIVEIFFDTFVVTTLTGILLLCAGTEDIGTLFAQCFGKVGRPLLAVLLAVFAYASMISWCFYSEGCILFLTDKKIFLTLYRVLSVAAAFFGAIASVQIIWDIADIFNGLMILPNMFLLFLRRNEITKRG